MANPRSEGGAGGGGGGGGGGLVGSGSASTEALRGVVCGLVYGATSPLVGHPLDSVKTRMQADARYAASSALQTARAIVASEGLRGLYRGLLPPLLGSSVFRSVQFSVYAGAISAARESPLLMREVPGAGGLQLRVLAAGLASSVARALIETPLELVKVRRQMGLGWLVAESAEQALRDPLRELRGLYRGLGVTFLRTWGLMGSFFVFVDVLERKHADLLAVPVLGPWMKGGVCTVAAWALVWPFEVIKNQVQASRGAEGDRRGWLARARAVLAERGLLGLYRGIGPGRECASPALFAACAGRARAPSTPPQLARALFLALASLSHLPPSRGARSTPPPSLARSGSRVHRQRRVDGGPDALPAVL